MKVYYNDNDAFVCAWLRNLIDAKLIAAGEVDCRSILEVNADDVRGFDQAHFFAGIGGWAYALQLAGWGDRPVWTGSCPCQPLSVAGQRKGHADERHLWPAFHRLIAECRPPTVFGEQVASKDGKEWFAGVRADLEASRYACGCADLPCGAFGFPHQRARLFWLASDADSERLQRRALRTEYCATGIRYEEFGRLVDDEIRLSVPTGRHSRRAHGIPNRVGLSRGFGNSVVPQVAAEFISAFMECVP